MEEFRLPPTVARDELEHRVPVRWQGTESSQLLSELERASATTVARLEAELRLAELEGVLGHDHGEA